jgi:periplasmic protein TonB
MTPLEIKQAGLLDILFENKNKAYGAYVLRNTYNSALWKALGFATLGITIIMYTVIVLTHNKEDDFNFDNESTFTNIGNSKPKEPITKPKKVVRVNEPKGTAIKSTVYTTPTMVTRAQVTLTPPVNANMNNTGAANTNGQLNGTPNVTKPSDSIVISTPVVVIVPKETPQAPIDLTQYEVKPQGWNAYLQKTLTEPTNRAAEEGCPTGRYRIVIRFEVDDSGNPSNPTVIETEVDYGLLETAKKLILKGPKWIAGTNSKGEKVKSIQQTAFIIEIVES